jgi:hypothetical protein
MLLLLPTKPNCFFTSQEGLVQLAERCFPSALVALRSLTSPKLTFDMNFEVAVGTVALLGDPYPPPTHTDTEQRA